MRKVVHQIRPNKKVLLCNRKRAYRPQRILLVACAVWGEGEGVPLSWSCPKWGQERKRGGEGVHLSWEMTEPTPARTWDRTLDRTSDRTRGYPLPLPSPGKDLVTEASVPLPQKGHGTRTQRVPAPTLPCEQTRTCKNITSRSTTYAGGNNSGVESFKSNAFRVEKFGGEGFNEKHLLRHRTALSYSVNPAVRSLKMKTYNPFYSCCVSQSVLEHNTHQRHVARELV